MYAVRIVMLDFMTSSDVGFNLYPIFFQLYIGYVLYLYSIDPNTLTPHSKTEDLNPSLKHF